MVLPLLSVSVSGGGRKKAGRKQNKWEKNCIRMGMTNAMAEVRWINGIETSGGGTTSLVVEEGYSEELTFEANQ